MMELLTDLLEIREIDLAIVAVEQQLALYPKMLAGLDARESAEKEKLQEAENSFTHAREARRKVELEVASLRERINKYIAQQGLVKTNKEYAAITHEIEGVKAQIDGLDIKGLEALEVEETSDNARHAASEAIRRLGTENATERARIASQSEDKKARLAELTAERDGRLARIAEDYREMYEILNNRYPGSALAPVADGCCGGCGMSLIKQLAIDVHRGEKLVRCQGCMRILYDPKMAGAT